MVDKILERMRRFVEFHKWNGIVLTNGRKVIKGNTSCIAEPFDFPKTEMPMDKGKYASGQWGG